MDLSREAATNRIAELEKEYQHYLKSPMNLTITRGVPGKEQLALSEPMLGLLNKPEDFISQETIDIRNYGELTGIYEAKKLFSELLGAGIEETVIGGNSSLSLMYLVLTTKFFMGEHPWQAEEKVKFLCPSPGYDRHFSMTEHLGIEMIPVEMDENGPKMDEVERLVSNDAAIKGIWCVPTYSNPTGVTYSDEVVDRLATMTTKAPDFTILWDNAYLVHHLTDVHETAKNILTTCKTVGNADRVWMFCSTSKITFPGAGVAALAASKANVALIADELSYQTIGYDKLNQMRHVKFLQNPEQVAAHMAKHAAILKPKFDLIKEKLHERFDGKPLVEWTEPAGGYFVHLTTLDGCATKIVAALDKIGVKVTNAGATYPYGKNPRDNSIRLAPTPVALADLDQAMNAIGLCIELVSLEKMYS
ncbi:MULTISPECIES: aminotransferase class I/II-fold pyridoxal phosphate-dependent enzyme [Carnobacterium]|uniref:Aminotransferase class I/II-fold pyridoxal phosphate-dependent enzyme n=1 Tax=Carnobacterium antarcticum TaxID=2126436 RepID=A0ABW4NQC2_9LACT|nr:MULTISPECIES: aminotransferase class I/II-fold pyridoxal phosphate-dependent enzyme [unclassified Carnobacterium]ALV21340.1 Aspartate transaminase [Carnobacterium sp. CP1]QQP69359.1 aminotransferase class I/II-fold pyridoxal phosphate-dependent enzyme [Carnobacterium sp. CS13]